MTRRSLVLSGLGVAAVTVAGSAQRWSPPPALPLADMARVPTPDVAATVAVRPPVQSALVQEALAALDRHQRFIKNRDRIAIVDFSMPSSNPRMAILDIASGKSTTYLVAHGSGSDPAHTGVLQRFSNEPNSNASSQGAFVTADYYVGKHGRSQRIMGLDPTNNNALERAIVVHGAWYADADMIPAHGKLGRSQGCFAVGDRELANVFEHLGQGRMIFSAKV